MTDAEVKGPKTLSLLDLPEPPKITWEAGKIQNQIHNIHENVSQMWELIWASAKKIQYLEKVIDNLQKGTIQNFTFMMSLFEAQGLVRFDKDKKLWQRIESK